jgi:uncharacterized protein YgbK (DUF1537 family)
MPGSRARPAPIAKDELLAGLPPEWPDDLLPAIRTALAESGQTLGVLDDDPTGTQTVHDVEVVTAWSEADLADAMADRRPCLYVLTNTRALPEREAALRAAEAARNLARAGRRLGREVVVDIRSDSTLRGHHPAETWAVRDVLEAEQGRPFDGELLAPFFPEGGRVTVDNVHYVLEAQRLVPAGQTEFARDSAFSYRASNLCDWVEEKARGRVKAADVICVSIDDLRLGGPDRVTGLLGKVSADRTVVVNAASYRDLEVFVLGLLRAESAGKRFLYRTAAGFVRVRIGQAGRLPLTFAELYPTGPSDLGGLIVVGSHVRRSTEQLAAALAALPDLAPVELHVGAVLDETGRETAIADAAAAVDRSLRAGQDTVLFTSRQPVRAGGHEADLRLSRRVSAALVETIRRLEATPRYLIAKGGITSSDLATEALGIRRAEVPGQVAPGVPCWRTGPGSRYPGIPYVVFPGNVGTPETLIEVIRLLRGTSPSPAHGRGSG